MKTAAEAVRKAVQPVHSIGHLTKVPTATAAVLPNTGTYPKAAITPWHQPFTGTHAPISRGPDQQRLEMNSGVLRQSSRVQAVASAGTMNGSKASSQPKRATTLHLLRALLREASYLPDPASRTYFKAHLASRFRDYCPRSSTSHSGPRAIQGNYAEAAPTAQVRQGRITRMLAQGRQELVFLKKANAGSTNSLQKVLELTYGRRGRRKHVLLKDVQLPQPKPMDNKDLEKLVEALQSEGNPTQNSRPRLPLFSDKFIALVKSQMRQKHAIFSKPVPKSNSPQVPEKNTWGRPMPVVRVKNITKRWYADTLERLMPPLPKSEWKRLEGLATGRVAWTQRPRRANGLHYPENETGGLNGPSKPTMRASHDVNPRYMRRMWANVFVQCPLMRWNSDRMKWDVQWGRVDEKKSLVLNSNKPLDFAPFEGVDEAGTVRSWAP